MLPWWIRNHQICLILTIWSICLVLASERGICPPCARSSIWICSYFFSYRCHGSKISWWVSPWKVSLQNSLNWTFFISPIAARHGSSNYCSIRPWTSSWRPSCLKPLFSLLISYFQTKTSNIQVVLIVIGHSNLEEFRAYTIYSIKSRWGGHHSSSWTFWIVWYLMAQFWNFFSFCVLLSDQRSANLNLSGIFNNISGSPNDLIPEDCIFEYLFFLLRPIKLKFQPFKLTELLLDWFLNWI